VKRVKEQAAAADRSKQSSIEPHLQSSAPPPKERTIPYTDALFRDAAIEWLIATDQVCQTMIPPSDGRLTDVN